MLYLLLSLLPIFGFQQIAPDKAPSSQNEVKTLNEVIIRFEYEGKAHKNAQVSPETLSQTAHHIAAANGLDTLPADAIRPLHKGLLQKMKASGETEAAILAKQALAKGKRIAPEFDPTTYNLSQSFVIKVPSDAAIWAKRIKENQASLGNGIRILDAFPNTLFSINAEPLYEQQWYLKNNGQTGGTAGADIHVEGAWNESRGTGITIAIIDTGIDYNHPDLAANIWNNPGEIAGNHIDDDENGYIDDVKGWDFIDETVFCASDEDCENQDNDPMDAQGHGTHCAGLAAAAENAIGIVGVAPDARIMPLRAGYKTFDDDGSLPFDAILEAITYATNQGADIISMSFGSQNAYAFPSEYQFALDSGVVLVCAAGNESRVGSSYPARFSQTISVGATDSDDLPAHFSNFGPTVDIMAPGFGLMSTRPGNRYQSLSGTSMSCPLVSGAIALLLQKRPNLKPSQIKYLLNNQADDLGTPGWDMETAFGRLNVEKLLNGPAPEPGFLDVSPASESFQDRYRIPGSLSGNQDIPGFIETDSQAPFSLAYLDTLNDEWFNLCAGSGPRQEMLCEDVLFSAVPEGRTVLRIQVEGPNQVIKTSYYPIWINNLLTSLSHGDTLNQGGERHGLINPFFDYDTIEVVYRRKGESQWHENGFHLQSKEDGLEFRWNNQDLQTDTTYDIQFRFRKDGTSFSKTYIDLKLDPELKGSWPRTYFTNFESQRLVARPGDVTPAVYDIDGDGTKEVLTYHQSSGSFLSVYDHEGRLKWSRNPENGLMPYYFNPKPTIIDINGRGQTGIIITHLMDLFQNSYENPGRIYMYDAEGNLYPGFPVKLPLGNHYFLAGADMDRDGMKDIVVASDYNFFVLGHDGTIKENWTLENGTPFLDSAIGNFDDDPQLEIAYRIENYSDGMSLRIADMDGTTISTWPASVPCRAMTNLFVVDADRDGNEDIVFIGRGDSSGLQIRDRNGELLPGWPQRIQGASNFTVGDPDGDGYPNIFITGGTNGLYQYNHKGDIMPGWPVTVGFTPSPALADLDGDGRSEVIIADHGNYPIWQGRFRVFNLAGEERFLFNKELPNVEPSWIFNRPIIDDLENDGGMEILYTINETGYKGEYHHQTSLNVWEIEGTHFNTVTNGTALHDAATTNRALTARRDFRSTLLMPHTPNNNDWFTSAFFANASSQDLPALMVDLDADGHIRAKKTTSIPAKAALWKKHLNHFFPRTNGPTGQIEMRLSSNSDPIQATLHIQARDKQQDIGLVFGPKAAHAAVTLDHIPSADWWLGIVVANNSDQAIQLFWEGSDGVILPLPENLNPSEPGAKKAFSLNDLVAPDQRPATARLLAYEAGSQLIDGEIMGQTVDALDNAYVLYGRQDQQWFSEGYMLPGDVDNTAESTTLFLPLATGAPFAEGNFYNGFAIRNHAEESATIGVTHFASTGEIVGEAELVLAAKEKRVFLPADLGLDAAKGGSLRLESNVGKLMGLFLSGDFTTHLAGGRLQTQSDAQAKWLGPWQNSVSKGSWLTLINTQPVATTVKLLQHSESGEVLEATETAIPAHGSLILDSANSPDAVTTISIDAVEDGQVLGYRFRYGKTENTLSSTSLNPID